MNNSLHIISPNTILYGSIAKAARFGTYEEVMLNNFENEEQQHNNPQFYSGHP